jgi:hypothetical protein
MIDLAILKKIGYKGANRTVYSLRTSRISTKHCSSMESCQQTGYETFLFHSPYPLSLFLRLFPSRPFLSRPLLHLYLSFFLISVFPPSIRSSAVTFFVHKMDQFK